MDDYEEHDGLGLAVLVERGETTPEALLEAAIARADARDGAIRSIVLRMDELARAAVAPGLPAGPFRGVPFLLKDLDVAWPGVRLTNGSRLFEDDVPKHESSIVARYRAAGLVVFGKTHSPEFGLTTTTESRLHGRTHNPWNLEHTPGGSSGGSAAAVAAGIVPLANASDGGGSIRIPASCCGLFGLKPTRGRTPKGPHNGEGWSGMGTVHAVTRSVRDSAALLDATAGPDLGAPYAAQPPKRPWLAEVDEAPGRLRIAVQRAPWNDVDPHADCLAALDDAIALCRDLGHVVEEAPFPVAAESLGLATGTIIAANTLAWMEQRAAELGRPLVEDDVEPGTWAIAEGARSRSAVDYVNALDTIHATGRALATHLERWDVLLSPTMATPPLPLGTLSLSNPDVGDYARGLFATIGYTQLANATGNPAMSLPLHWNGAGLPIGVQVLGRMDDEALLFRLAGQLERARPWWHRRPARADSDAKPPEPE